MGGMAKQDIPCIKEGGIVSDFDRVEWMEESHLKIGVEWGKFSGKIRAQFCDVILRNGRDRGPCWPRDGDFVCLEDESEIAFEDVTHVRYYEDFMPEDEPGIQGDTEGDMGSQSD